MMGAGGPCSKESIGQAKPGQDLLVIGQIGQLGTRILSAAFKQELTGWFSKSYIKKLESIQGLQVDHYIERIQRQGVTGILSAGEGGILKAIWDASGAWRVGVSFSLRKIPVQQGTIEICERCVCDPYRLWCGNCLVLAAENGGQLAEACEEWQIPAAVIGIVETGTARKLRHGEATGYLERPREDEIYRLLGRDRADHLRSAITTEKG